MIAPAPGPLFRRRAGLVVGVVHLPPLPGSPRWGGDFAAVLERARADLLVKHAAPLGAVALEDAARDAVERGLADGLILSGAGTGRPTDLDEVRRVRAALPEVPLLVGSGVDERTVREALAVADGVIVATSLRVGRVTT